MGKDQINLTITTAAETHTGDPTVNNIFIDRLIGIVADTDADVIAQQ